MHSISASKAREEILIRSFLKQVKFTVIFRTFYVFLKICPALYSREVNGTEVVHIAMYFRYYVKNSRKLNYDSKVFLKEK